MAKGIYKRENSKYYWIRYAGLDGKTVYESSGSTKFKDAEHLLLKRKNAIKEGKQPEAIRIKNYTFKQLTEKYCQWMQGRHRSAYSKQCRINTMLSHFGCLPLRRFTTLVVEQYQTDLISKGLKPASVNKNVSIIKAMIHKAVDWEMVEEETLKRVRNVKQLPENNRRLRYLSQEECQRLINSCDIHLQPIVITALNTGMRKGEILKLKWDNVDLNHGFILLDDTKNGERREIPINDTLRNTLQVLPRYVNCSYVLYQVVDGVDGEGHKIKKAIPYGDIKKSFATAVKRANIHDFKFHDLRHTFASHLVMAGVDITTVKELLGHKDIKMTLRYAHLAPAHKVKAMDVLDSAVNGVRNPSTIHLLDSSSKIEEEIKNLPTQLLESKG